MKKDDAERLIRNLCSEWAREKDIPMDGTSDPSFIEFYGWVKRSGHGSALDFRGRGGAIGYLRQWFDQEFKQTWKN